MQLDFEFWISTEHPLFRVRSIPLRRTFLFVGSAWWSMFSLLGAIFMFIAHGFRQGCKNICEEKSDEGRHLRKLLLDHLVSSGVWRTPYLVTRYFNALSRTSLTSRVRSESVFVTPADYNKKLSESRKSIGTSIVKCCRSASKKGYTLYHIRCSTSPV